MSSLAVALHATINTSEDRADKEHEQSTPNNLIKSKDSNDMETDGAKELGKHLDDLVGNNDDEEEDEAPNKEEISFGPGHSFFHPHRSCAPLWHQTSGLRIYRT